MRTRTRDNRMHISNKSQLIYDQRLTYPMPKTEKYLLHLFALSYSSSESY